MYIWMILATFIVMLATFNLSPRQDMAKQQTVPMAEAAVTKFLYQHKAAEKYIQNLISHNETILTDDHYNISVCNEYGEGDLCDYLPPKFAYDENSYYSYVYCLTPGTPNTICETDEEGEPVLDEEGKPVCHNELTDAGTAPTDCYPTTGNKKVRFVITIGRVPQRWKNVSTNRILGDYYTAMRRRIPVMMPCGIIVPQYEGDEKNKMGSNSIIDGVDILTDSIPPYFLENNSVFKDKCTTAIDGEFPCIICVTNL